MYYYNRRYLYNKAASGPYCVQPNSCITYGCSSSILQSKDSEYNSLKVVASGLPFWSESYYNQYDPNIPISTYNENYIYRITHNNEPPVNGIYHGYVPCYLFLSITNAKLKENGFCAVEMGDILHKLYTHGDNRWSGLYINCCNYFYSTFELFLKCRDENKCPKEPNIPKVNYGPIDLWIRVSFDNTIWEKYICEYDGDVVFHNYLGNYIGPHAYPPHTSTIRYRDIDINFDLDSSHIISSQCSMYDYSEVNLNVTDYSNPYAGFGDVLFSLPATNDNDHEGLNIQIKIFVDDSARIDDDVDFSEYNNNTCKKCDNLEYIYTASLSDIINYNNIANNLYKADMPEICNWCNSTNIDTINFYFEPSGIYVRPYFEFKRTSDNAIISRYRGNYIHPSGFVDGINKEMPLVYQSGVFVNGQPSEETKDMRCDFDKITAYIETYPRMDSYHRQQQDEFCRENCENVKQYIKVFGLSWNTHWTEKEFVLDGNCANGIYHVKYRSYVNDVPDDFPLILTCYNLGYNIYDPDRHCLTWSFNGETNNCLGLQCQINTQLTDVSIIYTLKISYSTCIEILENYATCSMGFPLCNTSYDITYRTEIPLITDCNHKFIDCNISRILSLYNENIYSGCSWAVGPDGSDCYNCNQTLTPEASVPYTVSGTPTLEWLSEDEL